MLKILVPATELFDPEKEVFKDSEDYVLELEHSLVSLSKWESKWEKPFLDKTEKSGEELLDYIRCMTLNAETPSEVYLRLTQENLEEINQYLNRKMTATWFRDTGPSKSREVITAELIYYWMIGLNIDWQAQYWHLNQLFTLIKVCNMKSGKPKKMGRSEAAARQRELNAQRRQKTGSTG